MQQDYRKIVINNKDYPWYKSSITGAEIKGLIDADKNNRVFLCNGFPKHEQIEIKDDDSVSIQDYKTYIFEVEGTNANGQATIESGDDNG